MKPSALKTSPKPQRQERDESATSKPCKSPRAEGEPSQVEQRKARRTRERNGKRQPSHATRTKDKGRTWGTWSRGVTTALMRNQTSGKPTNCAEETEVKVVEWTEFKSHQKPKGSSMGRVERRCMYPERERVKWCEKAKNKEPPPATRASRPSSTGGVKPGLWKVHSRRLVSTKGDCAVRKLRREMQDQIKNSEEMCLGEKTHLPPTHRSNLYVSLGTDQRLPRSASGEASSGLLPGRLFP